MNETLLIGDPPITIHLRSNPRAKRYSLRISNKDGKISLTMPRFAKLDEATKFAQDQEGWMRKHLSRQLPEVIPEFGGKILLDGLQHRIEHGEGRKITVGDMCLHVPGTEAQLLGKLRAFYKTMARERLVEASENYAAMIGKSIGPVSLRDTKSRWGSCGSDGKLMYSWRLMLAPREVQDYVAAHEVCHLIEMNHSSAFWNLVESIFPDYHAQKTWLKRNGQMLHSYKI